MFEKFTLQIHRNIDQTILENYTQPEIRSTKKLNKIQLTIAPSTIAIPFIQPVSASNSNINRRFIQNSVASSFKMHHMRCPRDSYEARVQDTQRTQGLIEGIGSECRRQISKALAGTELTSHSARSSGKCRVKSR